MAFPLVGMLAGLMGRIGAGSAAKGVGQAAVKLGTSKAVIPLPRGAATYALPEGRPVGGEPEQKQEGGKGSAAALALLGGKVGLVAGLFVGLAGVMARFSGSVLESSRSLTRYNAGIANTFGRLELAEAQRSIRMGKALAPSTAMLGTQWTRLQTELLPMREAIGVIKNYVAVGIVHLLRGIVAGVDALIEVSTLGTWNLEKISKELEKGKGEKGVSAQILNAIADKNFASGVAPRPPDRQQGL